MLAAVSDVERGVIPPLYELIFESRRRKVGKHAIMGLRYMIEKHLKLKALWGLRSPPIPDYHIVRCLHASSRISALRLDFTMQRSPHDEHSITLNSGIPEKCNHPVVSSRYKLGRS